MLAISSCLHENNSYLRPHSWPASSVLFMIPCLPSSSDSESLCIEVSRLWSSDLFLIFSLWHDALDLLSPSWLILKWTIDFLLFCPQIDVSVKLINKMIHRSIRLRSYLDYLDNIVIVTETKDSTSKLICFNPLKWWFNFVTLKYSVDIQSGSFF